MDEQHHHHHPNPNNNNDDDGSPKKILVVKITNDYPTTTISDEEIIKMAMPIPLQYLLVKTAERYVQYFTRKRPDSSFTYSKLVVIWVLSQTSKRTTNVQRRQATSTLFITNMTVLIMTEQSSDENQLDFSKSSFLPSSSSVSLKVEKKENVNREFL